MSDQLECKPGTRIPATELIQAINAKASAEEVAAHIDNTDNPHGVTYDNIGGTQPVPSSSMDKSIYDTDNNGIVDNAEKVNGLTVETSVPEDALFTDTIYDDTSVKVIEEKMITNNGFDRHNMDTLGIIEFCPDADAGIVYQYKNYNGVMKFYEYIGRSNFAAGTVDETPLVTNMLVIYPNYGAIESTFNYFVDSKKIEVSSLQSKLLPEENTGVVWFYFSRETLTLEASFTPTENLIIESAPLAIIYYNKEIGKHIIFANEQHGIAISGVLHAYLHNNMGALYTSGLDITGLVDGGNSYETITSGWIADEDINNYSDIQTDTQFMYKLGTSISWNTTTENLLLGHVNTGDTNVCINEWTGTEWVLSEIASNNFMLVHFLRTNDGKFPTVKIIGENAYGNAIQARVGAETEMANLILNGLPSPEIVSCYTVIINESGELVPLEDGSLALDWRGSKGAGSSSNGGTEIDSLHAALSDTDVDGHPTDAIVYNKTIKFTGVFDNGSTIIGSVIDLGVSQYQRITIEANITLTFINPAGPATIYLHIYQGSVGGLVTLPEGEWSNGRVVENNIEPDVGHDLLMIHYTGSGYIYGMMSNLSIPL